MTKEQIQAEIKKLEEQLNRENPWITDPRIKKLRELYSLLKSA